MNFVGEYIRKQRNLKKINLSKVSSDLKISTDLLKKIENDEIDKKIDIIFFLGHLRSYCKYLGLNTDEIINQFKLQHSFNKEIKLDQIPKPTSNYSFARVSQISSILTIFVIFTSFYYLFLKEDKKSLEYSLIPDLPENYEPLIEKEIVKMEINKEGTSNGNIEINDLNLNPSSVIASTNIEKDLINNQTVTLKFTNPTWLQLRDAKDSIILSQLMSKADEYSYDLNLNLSLTAGNAGNILVLINNDVRGKLGNFGEVVDSLIINSNFNN